MIRLGCLDHDPAKLATLPPARFGAVLAPAAIPCPTWQPQMWGNDTLPNCTAVALGNAARAWAHSQEAEDVAIDQAHVDALYAAAIGMPGATLEQLAATDGADPLAVTEQAQARGWDIGGQTPLVPDFATVAPNNWGIMLGLARTGGVMCALTLYAEDMDAFQSGKDWTAAPSGPVEGGHMVCIGAGDAQGAFLATWGTWQRASWDWIGARLRLALITGWRQLIPAGAAYRWVG